MLILKNISRLVTPTGNSAKKGKDMSLIHVVENAEIVVENGIIAYAGKATDNEYKGAEVIDCKGNAVLPAFVDSHTHIVFGGHREKEFMMRLSGATYMEIMNAGGGIASSVLATRKETEDSLVQSALLRLKELKDNGVASVEIKSGYGLDLETELKQLRAIRRIKEISPLDIKATFMGAHSVPLEYKGRGNDYIDYIISDVLSVVKKEKLADYVDIFCEKNVFSVMESRKLFTAAKEMGFKCRIHADEIVSTGGAEFAAKIGCVSADHLLKISDEGVAALSSSDTVATMLPLTAFALKEDYAPARRLIDGGAAVALATDFNPGSCFSSSIPLMIALAAGYMNMSINEIITALTLNGAAAIDLADKTGTIEIGKQADLILLRYPSEDFLAYHTGVNCVDTVIKKGREI